MRLEPIDSEAAVDPYELLQRCFPFVADLVVGEPERTEHRIHGGHEKANRNQTENFLAPLDLKLGRWEGWTLKFVLS